jgi:hypothetical protein
MSNSKLINSKFINYLRRNLVLSLDLDNFEISLVIATHLLKLNMKTVKKHLLSKLIGYYCQYIALLYPDNLLDIYNIWNKLLDNNDLELLQNLIQFQINTKTNHLQKMMTIYSHPNIDIPTPPLDNIIWNKQLPLDTNNLKHNMLSFIYYLNLDSYSCLKYVFNILQLSKKEKSDTRFIHWKPKMITNTQKILGKCQKGEYAIWEYLLSTVDNKQLLTQLEILFLFYYKLNDKKHFLICAVILVLLFRKKRLHKKPYKIINNINIDTYLDLNMRTQFLNNNLPLTINSIQFIDNYTEPNDLKKYNQIKKPIKKKKLITLTNENELIMDPIPIN